MHVIKALSTDFYEVEFSGRKASMWDVFQNGTPHDRFGILIYEPLAALGATHLIQMACMCFYDIKPSRRVDRKIYPEIFAIHVGGWWGGHGNFDFWPPRREIQVPNDPCEILGAINDFGLTRLALPEREARDIVHRRKEEDCALDRLVTSIMYNSSGRVTEADFTIRSNSPRSERDVQRNIHPVQVSERSLMQMAKATLPVKEVDADFLIRQNELNVNITSPIRELAERNRAELKIDGLITESYRFIEPSLSLKCL
ncbi:hypothetical protein [Pseudomonas aeruginosa]|uniref:hypothetical protein n=1 Tax=Pseudomonas aeruginosa TaxID=287 RepID=UPI0021F1B4FD|nr:hypothetical protein [Pseudomonas aeruginosa]MCV6454945.1 hypothetical protein [Pseudomonas aeruginosa]